MGSQVSIFALANWNPIELPLNNVGQLREERAVNVTVPHFIYNLLPVRLVQLVIV